MDQSPIPERDAIGSLLRLLFSADCRFDGPSCWLMDTLYLEDFIQAVSYTLDLKLYSHVQNPGGNLRGLGQKVPQRRVR